MLFDEYNEIEHLKVVREEGIEIGRKKMIKEVCEIFPKVCRMFRENKSDKEIIDELHLSDKNFDFYKKLYNKTKDLY